MLNSTVYHLGAGGKLTPVQTLTELIGQKVHHDEGTLPCRGK